MPSPNERIWPALPLGEWKDTCATLHLWTQIIGKCALKLAPFVNHWWETALHVSARGLRTGLIPYGHRVFEIEFDFVDNVLAIRTADGDYRAMGLFARSVADFYAEFLGLMCSLGFELALDPMPKEIPNPIAFDMDQTHAAYDPEYAQRFWRILVQADRLFQKFRGGFIGKSSPVHFFWGSFDLAVTRFSGRRAPERPKADHITRVAYSHEVISVGFWPGSGNIQEPAFYSYAAPEPQGFAQAAVTPATAFYNAPTKGFILRYEDVRASADPDQTVLSFCQSTYEAGAKLGQWDRAELERRVPEPAQVA